ncbi:hypothetical protein GCM10007205_05850 [Oxalicibacterium flavum]|uniref:DUF2946 domain-containing protein n=1 Tax=Oxalicibacterium flavum TaxID=179467 RepID=A0A8J2UL50_9BURK|nr:DUF2946 domain-containing protein [Oxalicibacterium flavum]GGB99365.1 hypothetical protein GCM10007205_05850 [Oxalicibacterium flavum]
MKTARTMHRIAWIACFAILLAALAPAISHALAPHTGQQAFVEICTAQGSKLIEAADQKNPESPQPQQHTDHFEHCPFCKSNNVANGLPPTVFPLFATLQQPSHFPILFYQAPRGLFVWTTASPRAPPVLS